MDWSAVFKERDPTQGSIIKCTLLMTWPLWLNTVIWIVSHGLNIYWVSKVGPEALAAVVAGNTAFMLMMALVQGLVIAGHSLIGSLAGSRNKEELDKTAKEILLTGFILSLVLASLGSIFAPRLLNLIGTEEKILSLAAVYLRIQAIGGIISFSLWVICGMLRAVRDMIRPMIMIFLVIILQIIFDWLLVLGNLGFPKLEVIGAALSSAMSASIGALIGLKIILKGTSGIKIGIKKWNESKIRLSTIKEIIRISGFQSIDQVGKAGFDLIVLGIVASWGTASLAAYSIGVRLLRMTSVLGLDLGITTIIAVSNNLGAGKEKKAEKYVWINVGINILMMGAGALALFIFADKIMHFYCLESKIVLIGIDYLRITAFGYVFIAATTILSKAFAGAKNTKIPAAITFITSLILVILAKYLPTIGDMGIGGIWYAILISVVLNGLILVILFKIGVWKRKTK
jgi:putative MATE family efflux protein